MKLKKIKRFEVGIFFKNVLIFFCGKYMVNIFLIL